MTDYFRDRDKAEKAELKKAKEKLKAQQQPILKPVKYKTLAQSPQYQDAERRTAEAKKKKKRKRRTSRPVSTKVAKSIRKAERQFTGTMFRDTPPNVMGLRRKPRTGRKQKSPNGRSVIDEFLS